MFWFCLDLTVFYLCFWTAFCAVSCGLRSIGSEPVFVVWVLERLFLEVICHICTLIVFSYSSTAVASVIAQTLLFGVSCHSWGTYCDYMFYPLQWYRRLLSASVFWFVIGETCGLRVTQRHFWLLQYSTLTFLDKRDQWKTSIGFTIWAEEIRKQMDAIRMSSKSWIPFMLVLILVSLGLCNT